MTLPSETDLARETGKNVDPDILFSARASLRREFGEALKSTLEDVYARSANEGGYSPDARAQDGERSERRA